jgi:hypothetical protein
LIINVLFDDIEECFLCIFYEFIIDINGINLFGEESHSNLNVKKAFITTYVQDVFIGEIFWIDELKPAVIVSIFEGCTFPH